MEKSVSNRITRRTIMRFIGGAAVINSGLAACASPQSGNPSPIPQDLAPRGALDQFVQKKADQEQFSGTLLIAKGDQPILLKTYGLANRAQSLPNRQDTIYALGSVTKSFTAVAIMQLVQQGRLALQDPLGKYLSDFPTSVAQEVTIHQLLTHTSGMGDIFQDPEAYSQSASWTSAEQTMTGLLASIRQQSLKFTPGSSYFYSNAGYVILGAIVQQVAGQSYYDYIHQHIFQAAGMNQSDFYTRPQIAENSQIAHPYTTVGGPVYFVPPGPDQPENGSLIDASKMTGYIGYPCGSAYSNVQDMLRYSQAVQNYTLLNEESTKLLTTGKVEMPPSGPNQGKYAYGLMESIVNGQRVIWHGGGAPGTAAQFAMYPALGRTMVILSNYDPDQSFQELVKEAENMVVTP